MLRLSTKYADTCIDREISLVKFDMMVYVKYDSKIINMADTLA